MEKKWLVSLKPVTIGFNNSNADTAFHWEGEQTKRKMLPMMAGKPFSNFIETLGRLCSPKEGEVKDQLWILQPGSGLDKRQATLQLCIRAEGQQTVKPAIIFRGKGNISTEE